MYICIMLFKYVWGIHFQSVSNGVFKTKLLHVKGVWCGIMILLSEKLTFVPYAMQLIYAHDFDVFLMLCLCVFL